MLPRLHIQCIEVILEYKFLQGGDGGEEGYEGEEGEERRRHLERGVRMVDNVGTL